jgi:hypothetical protein
MCITNPDGAFEELPDLGALIIHCIIIRFIITRASSVERQLLSCFDCLFTCLVFAYIMLRLLHTFIFSNVYIKYRSSSAERRASSVERRASSVERQIFSIDRRTPSVES